MKVAVLGAGLQGVCIALELARRGIKVELIDRDERPLNRASLRNEGKIHLGLVYAKDATMQTAESMLDGALSFGNLLNRWTDGAFASVAQSRPFTYLVARDSQLEPEELAHHYERVEQSYRARVASDPSLDYLGGRPEHLWRPVKLTDVYRTGVPDLVTAAFETVQTAVDLITMTALLRDAVASSPSIRFHAKHRVTAVRRREANFRVEEHDDGSSWTLDCDQVVNALWDGRLAIDASVGIHPQRRWSHRMKYRVLVDLPPELHDRPSATFVLGAYGDVVVHPGGRGYVSWYPECMQGWSEDLAPPDSWDAPCRGYVPDTEAAELASRVLNATDRWFPGLAAARPYAVDAGVIFAFGETDITDPSSHLHCRDEMGVQSVEGYHSVNTGKLTTAPLFALRAADAIAGN